MNEKKKDNAFVRWTEKHAEIWKFIKFTIAGGGSSAVELVVHMVLHLPNLHHRGLRHRLYPEPKDHL